MSEEELKKEALRLGVNPESVYIGQLIAERRQPERYAEAANIVRAQAEGGKIFRQLTGTELEERALAGARAPITGRFFGVNDLTPEYRSLLNQVTGKSAGMWRIQDFGGEDRKKLLALRRYGFVRILKDGRIYHPMYLYVAGVGAIEQLQQYGQGELGPEQPKWARMEE